MTTLNLAGKQLKRVREQMEIGADRAARGMRASGVEVDLALLGLECCTLGEFSAEAGELVAGVVQRHSGSLCGTAVMSLEPEDALFWVRLTGSQDPLEQFVSLGRTLLEHMVAATAEAFGAGTQPGRARLVEDSVVAIVIGTHAPSDTLILGARLDLCAAGRSLPVRVNLLLEPKPFETLSAVDPRGESA